MATPAISLASRQRISDTCERVLSPSICAIPAAISLGNEPGAISFAATLREVLGLRARGAPGIVDQDLERQLAVRDADRGLGVALVNQQVCRARDAFALLGLLLD